MSNSKVNTMLNYFDKHILLCKEREQSLQEENRKDESNFEKIKLNVYDIFKTMFTVSVKTAGDKEEVIKNIFLQKLELIPSNWVKSLAQAKEHNDTEKICIEEIKLGIVNEIKATFNSIWEGI